MTYHVPNLDVDSVQGMYAACIGENDDEAIAVKVRESLVADLEELIETDRIGKAIAFHKTVGDVEYAGVLKKYKTSGDASAVLAFRDTQAVTPFYVKTLGPSTSGNVPCINLDDGRGARIYGMDGSSRQLDARCVDSARMPILQCGGTCYLHSAMNCIINSPVTRAMKDGLGYLVEDADKDVVASDVDAIAKMLRNGKGRGKDFMAMALKNEESFDATRRSVLLGVLKAAGKPSKRDGAVRDERLCDLYHVASLWYSDLLSGDLEGGYQQECVLRMMNAAGADLDFFRGKEDPVDSVDTHLPNVFRANFDNGVSAVLCREHGPPPETGDECSGLADIRDRDEYAGFVNPQSGGATGHAVAYARVDGKLVYLDSNVPVPVSDFPASNHYKLYVTKAGKQEGGGLASLAYRSGNPSHAIPSVRTPLRFEASRAVSTVVGAGERRAALVALECVMLHSMLEAFAPDSMQGGGDVRTTAVMAASALVLVAASLVPRA